jgi:hypothetical protein
MRSVLQALHLVSSPDDERRRSEDEQRLDEAERRLRSLTKRVDRLAALSAAANTARWWRQHD